MPSTSPVLHIIAFHNWIRHVREKKAKLPASVDDCMAYLTGYKKTSLSPLKSKAEFFDLVKKLIVYCNLAQDKETLRLLYYSVLKRATEGRPHKLHCSVFRAIRIFWDHMTLDLTGLYGGNMTLQLHDMSRIFLILVNYLDEEEQKKERKEEQKKERKKERKEERNKPKKGKKYILNINPSVPWTEDNAPNKKLRDEAQKLKEWVNSSVSNTHVYFNRGGGLYHFLDVLKKLSPGTKADNHDDLGLYVTPSFIEQDQAERDSCYANDPGRARAHGDIPSTQSGRITKKSVFSENHNDYEAFIHTEDFVQSKQHCKIKLSLPPKETNCEFFTVTDWEEIEQYSAKDEGLDSFKKRMTAIDTALDQKYRKKMKHPWDEEKESALRKDCESHFTIKPTPADIQIFNSQASQALEDEAAEVAVASSTLKPS